MEHFLPLFGDRRLGPPPRDQRAWGVTGRQSGGGGVSSGKVGGDERAAAPLASCWRTSSWPSGHLWPPESMSRVLGQCRTYVVGGCLSMPRLRAGPVAIAELPVDTLRIPCGEKPRCLHEGPVLACQAISSPEPQSLSFLCEVLARKPPSRPRDQLHLTGLLCAWPFL